jgi:ABC-type transport system involved in cytochrome bd biosynthesis fused ATPase/permease subunit
MGEAEREREEELDFAAGDGLLRCRNIFAGVNPAGRKDRNDVATPSIQIHPFLIVFFRTLQPHALSKLVSYFSPGQTEMTRQDLYFYSGLLIGINVVDCIYHHNYYLAVLELHVKIRAAFSSFIYRKTLKLSPDRLGDISIGKIVTLITKDVPSLENFSYLVNDIWLAFAKTAIVCFIVYRKIGVAVLAGVGFFVIILPLQGKLRRRLKHHLLNNFQYIWARGRLNCE